MQHASLSLSLPPAESLQGLSHFPAKDIPLLEDQTYQTNRYIFPKPLLAGSFWGGFRFFLPPDFPFRPGTCCFGSLGEGAIRGRARRCGSRTSVCPGLGGAHGEPRHERTGSGGRRVRLSAWRPPGLGFGTKLQTQSRQRKREKPWKLRSSGSSWVHFLRGVVFQLGGIPRFCQVHGSGIPRDPLNMVYMVGSVCITKCSRVIATCVCGPS